MTKFIFVIFLFFKMTSAQNCECGKNTRLRGENNSDDCDLVKRVVTGSPGGILEAGSFPWMVSIGKEDTDGNWYHNCGGSLIDDQHVLTAAHCLDAQDLKLRFGDVNLTSIKDDKLVQMAEVTQVFKHPKFNRLEAYYDVAVVRFEPRVQFSYAVRPICLPETTSSDQDKYSGYLVRLAGYGSEGLKYLTPSNVLKSAKLKVLFTGQCNATYSNQGLVETIRRNVKISIPQMFQSNIMCAGDEFDNYGPCEGDSGGPLIKLDFKNNEESYVQIGVVQGGLGECGARDFPGIYIRLNSPPILDFVKGILENDIKTQTINKNQMSKEERLIQCAKRQRCSDIVNLLSERKVNIFYMDIDNYNYTFLHHLSKIGDENCIKRVLSKLTNRQRSLLINSETDYGGTTLYVAAAYGNFDCVKLLLRSGAILDAEENDGKTALFSASYYGFPDTVAHLIAKGADLNIQTRQDGFTPLQVASFEGHLEVVRVLASSGAKLDQRSLDGRTAFYMACQNGKLKVVKYLKAIGADFRIKQESGWSALMVASFYGHDEVVEYLIDLGFDIKETNDNGEDSLDLAKRQRNESTINLLKDRLNKPID